MELRIIPALSPESIKIEGKIGARLNALCYVWGHKDKGKFRGLVISEVALFRLSKSAFEFDPIFKQVPILPVLRPRDYLHVE